MNEITALLSQETAARELTTMEWNGPSIEETISKLAQETFSKNPYLNFNFWKEIVASCGFNNDPLVLKSFLAKTYFSNMLDGEENLNSFFSASSLPSNSVENLGAICDVLGLVLPKERNLETLNAITSVCQQLDSSTLSQLALILKSAKASIPCLFEAAKKAKVNPEYLGIYICGLSVWSDKQIKTVILNSETSIFEEAQTPNDFMLQLVLKTNSPYRSNLEALLNLCSNLIEKTSLLKSLYSESLSDAENPSHFLLSIAEGNNQKKILNWMLGKTASEVLKWATINSPVLEKFKEHAQFDRLLAILMLIEPSETLASHLTSLSIEEFRQNNEFIETACLKHFYEASGSPLFWQRCGDLFHSQETNEPYRDNLFLELYRGDKASHETTIEVLFDYFNDVQPHLKCYFIHVFEKLEEEFQKNIINYVRDVKMRGRLNIPSFYNFKELGSLLLCLAQQEDKGSIFTKLNNILGRLSESKEPVLARDNLDTFLKIFNSTNREQCEQVVEQLELLLPLTQGHEMSALVAVSLLLDHPSPPFLQRAIAILSKITDSKSLVMHLFILLGLPPQSRESALDFLCAQNVRGTSNTKTLLVYILRQLTGKISTLHERYLEEVLNNIQNPFSIYDLVSKYCSLDKDQLLIFLDLFNSYISGLNGNEKKEMCETLASIDSANFISVGEIARTLAEQLWTETARIDLILSIARIPENQRQATIEFLTNNHSSIISEAKFIPELAILRLLGEDEQTEKNQDLICSILSNESGGEAEAEIVRITHEIHDSHGSILPFIKATKIILDDLEDEKGIPSAECILQFLSYFSKEDLDTASQHFIKLVQVFGDEGVEKHLPFFALFPKDLLIPILELILGNHFNLDHQLMANIMNAFDLEQRDRVYAHFMQKVTIDPEQSSQTIINGIYSLATKIIEWSQSLLLTEEHFLFQAAIQFVTTLGTPLTDPKNPIKIYLDCKKNLIEGKTPQVKQKPIDINDPLYKGGPLYRLNLQARSSLQPLTRRDLPQGVHSLTLKKLCNTFIKRFNNLTPEGKAQLLNHIRNEQNQGEPNFLNRLMTNLLKNPYILTLTNQFPKPPSVPGEKQEADGTIELENRLVLQDQPGVEDVIPPAQDPMIEDAPISPAKTEPGIEDRLIDLPVFHLAQILKVLTTLSDEVKDKPLSEQEEELLALSGYLQNCSNQFNIAFRALYTHFSKLHTFIHPTNAAAHKKLFAFIDGIVQNELEQLFDFNLAPNLVNTCFSGQKKENIEASIKADEVQYVTYLKNMLGPNFGLAQKPHYDAHTAFIHEDFLKLSRDELIQAMIDNDYYRKVKAPVEQSPVEQAPIEQSPVEQSLVEQAPVEQSLVEQAPIEQSPVEQTPINLGLFEQTLFDRIKEKINERLETSGIDKFLPTLGTFYEYFEKSDNSTSGASDGTAPSVKKQKTEGYRERYFKINNDTYVCTITDAGVLKICLDYGLLTPQTATKADSKREE